MADYNMIFAGFGGQGVLFAGKIVAHAGLLQDQNVSWMPSYGPEMRGGTANCSVCLSDKEIGSPLVNEPDGLVAMNNPSFEKFIDGVKPGGIVVLDSSLVSLKTDRTDVKVFEIPATELSKKHGLDSLANIILLGKLTKELPFASWEIVEQAIRENVPERLKHLTEPNMKALALGRDY